MKALLKNFLDDDRGTSMIEFAIVAPFLIGLLLFTSATNETVYTSAQVSKISISVSDIISQSKTVTAEVIDTTFDVADILVNSSNSANLEMYIAGIEVEPSDVDGEDFKAVVLWSRDNGNLSTITKPAKDSEYNLPDNLLQRAGFIVTTRVRLAHSNSVSKLKDSKLNQLTLVNSMTSALMGEVVSDYENHFVPRESEITSCVSCTN